MKWLAQALTLVSLTFPHLNEAISMSLERNAASRSSEFAKLSVSSKVRVLSTEEIEANMTLKRAYTKFLRMNHSKQDKMVLSFIERSVQGKGTEHKSDKQTPQDYMDSVDRARILLNEMMDEAMIECDQEEISCTETEAQTWKAIKDTEHTISYANAEATGARMEILRAKEIIRILEEVNIPTAKEELIEHNRKCEEDEATLRQQLAIVKSDRTVVEQILEMICADDVRTPAPDMVTQSGQTPSFVQLESSSNLTDQGMLKCVSCHTGREAIWFRHMKIEPLLAKLKSGVTKDFVEKNLMEEFSRPDKRHPVRTVFLAESEKEKRMKNPVTVPALESRFNVTVEELPPPGTCNEQMVGEDSVGYRGCQSKTIHGKQCQAWDSAIPHNHSFTSDQYPDSGLGGGHSYCRNPNNRSTIWCITTDPSTEWEYCEPLLELAHPGEAARYGGCEELDLCRFRKSDCVKMTDRFMVILASIIDNEQYLTNTLDRVLKECEITRNSYRTSIESMEAQLSEEQTNLASAQKTLIENIDTSQRENERHADLKQEYNEENEECCNNINEWKGQICAIKKIRGELYKLQGMNVTINDCEVGDWVEEECSVSCGGGTQSITRSITIHPNLGMQCPPLHGERACNLEGCPVDCEVGEWEGWGPCTADCNGGVQSRTRQKTVEPENGGDACPELSETRDCNTQACSAPCELADWADWGMCSKQCDTGHEERTKSIRTPAVGQGTCPSLISPERYGTRTCSDYNCQSLLTGDRTTLQCNAMVDLVLVLDGSGSLGDEGWAETKSLARKLVDTMDFGEMKVQMSILLFSGPWSTFALNRCVGDNPNDIPSRTDCGQYWISHMTTDKAALHAAIEGMDWPARTTLTSVAISEASQELISGRQDALPVIMVVTDGKPMFKTRTEQVSAEIRSHARLMFVPVQASDDMIDEMRGLASTPTDDNVIPISDFAVMDTPQTLNRMVSSICSSVD